ncbi:hypothetical protein Glove_606g44 [Diversispora epigaea]|uniref:Uncharacterized protein n=1 Tax=Diversispora epigaea TaxID=1348612 RepID=A0A397G8E0_9GLOM|nr:hypothetical protein Glove_606g44 [Diversispora epigaea]
MESIFIPCYQIIYLFFQGDLYVYGIWDWASEYRQQGEPYGVGYYHFWMENNKDEHKGCRQTHQEL